MRRCRALILVPMVSALLLAGCVKFEHRLIVLPDGSGKLILHHAHDPKLTKDDPLAALDDPTLARHAFKGHAAVTATEWSKDGWDHREVTVHFDDVNRFEVLYTALVEVPGEEGDDEVVFEFVPRTQLGFRFEKTEDGGHRLTVTNATGTMLGDVIGGDGEGLSDEERTRTEAQTAKALEGFALRESYTLPGAVTSTEGLPKRDGRTATFEFGPGDVNTPAKWKKHFGSRTQRVVCGPSTMNESELAAEREEATKAKAEWRKRLAALRDR